MNDAIQAIVPILVAAIAWSLNEWGKRRYDRFKNKVNCYHSMIDSTYGFYEDSQNAELKRRFINNLYLCWLYAPDKVIRKGVRFLEDAKGTHEKSEKSLRDFIMAMRKDLLGKTDIEPNEFNFYGAGKSKYD